MELSEIQLKREKIFWILSAVFLSSMTLLNVIGITKFIDVFGLSVAVGVLPYPITFLCTDLISELYGKARANFLVWIGLFINLFVLFFIWASHKLQAVNSDLQPPWQEFQLSETVFLANGSLAKGQVELFDFIYASASGAVAASMVAYMLAQFFDVYIFHYLKEKTKGKHLWLRNNVSTLCSQFVDSFAVVGITFGAVFFQGEMTAKNMLVLFLGNYAFKALAALIDTPIFYLLSLKLKSYLDLEDTYEV